jgi:hypothetical protein
MFKTSRTWTLAALGLVALSGSAMAGGHRVVVVGPPPVVVSPVQTVYTTSVPVTYSVAPVQTVYATSVPVTYSETVVTRTPVGPTAYVEAIPTSVVIPTRRVMTTTTTVVPTRTIITDPALTPVGYEVIGPRRTKIVYPRRVYRYGY